MEQRKARGELNDLSVHVGPRQGGEEGLGQGVSFAHPGLSFLEQRQHHLRSRSTARQTLGFGDDKVRSRRWSLSVDGRGLNDVGTDGVSIHRRLANNWPDAKWSSDHGVHQVQRRR